MGNKLKNKGNLNGRTAIVTGASRGIGRAIALKLAQEGANIAFNYVSEEDHAESLKKEIEKLGVSAMAFRVDVRDYDTVQKMRETIVREIEGLDILVNNAGILKDAALMMMTPEDWQEVIDTNLTGTFNMTRAVITTFMKQKRGNIINIASVSGLGGMARQTNYASSKGGMIAFAKSLAKEVAGHNIRVNAVVPGYIETDMIRHLKEDQLKAALDRIPLGRLGTPEDVANAVYFLLTPAAQYITGQIIQVDGGMGM
jgi:3-oxoacyl-[acyl-carrier protein] reductase